MKISFSPYLKMTLPRLEVCLTFSFAYFTVTLKVNINDASCIYFMFFLSWEELFLVVFITAIVALSVYHSIGNNYKYQNLAGEKGYDIIVCIPPCGKIRGKGRLGYLVIHKSLVGPVR